MKNRIKNNILIIGIILGLLLVLVSIALASNSKKIVTQEFYQNKKALEIERNYQNVDTGTYYEALAEALEAVESNQTIKVLNSKIETVEPLLAEGKIGIKLDLNGQSVTLSGIALTNNGKLDIYNSSSTEGKLIGTGERTVINSGVLTTNVTKSTNKLTIINTSAESSARVLLNEVGEKVTLNTNTYLNFTTATSGDRYVITTKGELTIAGATITNNSGSTTATWDRGLQVANSAGKITISSGTVNTPGIAVIASSVTAGESATTSVEITGGTITAATGAVVYNNHSINKVIISGGTLTGACTAYNANTGTLDITGGRLSTTNAQAVRNNSTGKVTISGGTITSVSGICVYNAGEGEIAITGGTITSTENTGVQARAGTVTIGTNEQPPLVSITEPKITGANRGVYVEGTLNFYDGVIIGESGRTSIGGAVVTTPAGYTVVKTYDELTTKETALLQKLSTTEKIVNKIEIKTMPTQINYIQNYETLNTSGGKLLVTYNDSSIEEKHITEDMVIGFTNTNLGKITLTVNYEGKTTTFDVTIINNYKELEEWQKAIQEVAYAYYMRGANIQYNPHKFVYGVYSPEEATSQNLNYACCSHYEKNVYYDLFGIMIPASVEDKLKYGKDNLGKPEVIAYGKRNNENNVIMNFYDENTSNNYITKTNPTLEEIIPYLKIRRCTYIYRSYNDGI